jgi:DNA-binding transcriptional ArsR family regulator
MSQTFPSVVNALRAAAEPTRLRLLAVLRHGELTVGELCAVLGQSQPRVSRHLKVLCDAGLLARFKEEHWVYYRVPLHGASRESANQLAALMFADDPVLMVDQQRMAKVLAERPEVESDKTDVNAALRELDKTLLAELGTEPLGELIDIATGSGRILRTLGARATHAVGVDISTEALRFARKQTYAGRDGLSHCEFRRGDMYQLPFADGSFNTATLERVLAAAERVADVLSQAARVLRPGGRLCVVEDFELLSAGGQNPLRLLAGWLQQAGLICERLRPVDAHGVHLVVALARKPAVQSAAA